MGRFRLVTPAALAGVLALYGCAEDPAPLAPTDGLSGVYGSPLFASATNVIRVPDDFATIQAAVDAAEAGDIIQVAAGTYAERVVIQTSHIRLHGQGGAEGARPVLDGSGVGGTGIGIHVRGTTAEPLTGVEIHGFVVRGFEVGIELENVRASRVQRNDVSENTDKDPTTAPFIADGIVLAAAHDNTVIGNSTHRNGHNGIFLTGGSSGNTIGANRSHDNGAQTGAGRGGCGIQVSGGANNDNRISENEVRGTQGWGILIGPAGTSVGNVVAQNRVHGSDRAGIAVRGSSSGNFIRQNDARGNGLAGLSPSGNFDLFDEPPTDNTWERNRGTANF